jgi:hypothetical protein
METVQDARQFFLAMLGISLSFQPKVRRATTLRSHHLAAFAFPGQPRRPHACFSPSPPLPLVSISS